MDWIKYNQVPTEYATASAIGLAAATLGAMARRGFVEVLDTKPKQYRRVVTAQVTVYKLLDENKSNFKEFFTLRKEGAPYGMLCTVDSSGDVRDCWGNKYDLTGVNYAKFGKKEYHI
jgi:hypothetical protein